MIDRSLHLNLPDDGSASYELLACLGIILILGWFAGFLGIGTGLVILVSWALFGVPVAIAVGHVFLLGLFPDGVATASFLVIEAGFVLLLVAGIPVISRPQQTVTATILFLLVAGGITWLAVSTQPLWAAVQ